MPSPESSPLHIPNRPAPCLRLDLSSGESLVLPWHQMIFARLGASGTELLIRFGCGDAVIAGENLKEVREALWSQEAGRIGPGEDAKGKPVITSVTFKEIKAGGGDDGDAGDGEDEDGYEEDFR